MMIGGRGGGISSIFVLLINDITTFVYRQVVISWVQYNKDSKKKRLSYHIAKKHWKSNLLTKVRVLI